jgi:MFS family permease
MNIRLILVRCIGVLFLLIGLISLYAVPAEFTSFYSFSTGGDFYYEGFGFGSLLFATILISALLYATLALIGIPVGIGNIQSTSWGYRLSCIFLVSVIAIGASFVICIGLSFRLLDSLIVSQYILILFILIQMLVVLPYLLLRFYRNQNTKRLFSPSRNAFFVNQSESKMVSIFLNLMWVIAFVVMIFLKGAFPFMGVFVFKTLGTYLLSAAILVLLVLSYLFYKNIKQIKYVMLAFYVFLFLSFVITFVIVPGKDFVGMLELPAYEMREMASLLNLVAGINAGYFFGTILVIQTILLLTDKMPINNA